MPLVSKSMPCRQQPFETTSSPAWKANRRARRRPHGPHSPTRDRTVRRRQGLSVPNLGDNREGSVRRFREWREDGCLQYHPAASADFGIRGRGEHALSIATFSLSVISSSYLADFLFFRQYQLVSVCSLLERRPHTGPQGDRKALAWLSNGLFPRSFPGMKNAANLLD